MTAIDNAPALEALAEQIEIEHAACEAMQNAALAHAIVCGEKLIAAKRLAGHGNWLPWVAENLSFGERTATNYMRIARNRQRVSDLRTVREALAELADPEPVWTKPPPPSLFKVKSDLTGEHTRRASPRVGLFRWMVPWVAQCPCCGTVEVYPEPAQPHTPRPPSRRNSATRPRLPGSDVQADALLEVTAAVGHAPSARGRPRVRRPADPRTRP
jgi:hypothetical protein